MLEDRFLKMDSKLQEYKRTTVVEKKPNRNKDEQMSFKTINDSLMSGFAKDRKKKYQETVNPLGACEKNKQFAKIIKQNKRGISKKKWGHKECECTK